MALAPDPAAYELIDTPVVLTDPRGIVLWCNTAFARQSGQVADVVRGASIEDALGVDDHGRSALASALASGPDVPALAVDAIDAAGRPWPLCLSGHAVAAGWVLTLQPGTEGSPLRDEVARLNDKLDLACELGRLGVWERDIATGVGRWDDSMWRMWGLPPQPLAMPRDEYLSHLNPEDREALRQRNAESIRRPGRYELPYRINRPDGTQLQVHSRWEVRTDAQGRPTQMLGIVRDDTEVYRLATRIDEAQTQLQLAMDLAEIAVWRFDHRHDRVRIDAKGWAMLGRPARGESVAGAEIRALVHPDDLADLHLRQAAAAGGGTGTTRRDLTLRMRRPDNQWRYLLLRSVAQRDAEQRATELIGVALDVTERFESSQRALELARRLETATAAAGLGTWEYLPGIDWHWDVQMRLLHGLPADATLPDRRGYVDEFVHADDRAAVREAMHGLRQRAEGMVDLDLRLQGRDGVLRRVATRTTIETLGGQRRIFGVVLDVTARHRSEERLREAGERAALAARGAGIGTWESAPDAKLSWWDEQMFRLRGRPARAEPVPIDEMLEWVHPDDRALFDPWRQAPQRLPPSSSYEFRVVWPDGSVHWIASRSSSVLDAAGRVARRIGINWDITEARNAAAARQEKLLAQRESQAKSRFLARMSHELRTPLNAVLGFSQLLLADVVPADPAVWRERVEHVRAAGEHLLMLIDDVLDLSSLESGELPLQLQPVAMATLVRTTLPMLQTQADAAGVRIHPGNPQGNALADPVRLRQVLINLLSNGLKYNRPGGEVWIEAAPHEGRMRLAVRDNGLGLSEDQRRHLFEPFNRLGRDRQQIEGTGIGLAIVKASVLHMGGSIEVHSREGEGSCFALSLALSAEMPARPPAAFGGSPLMLPMAAGAATPWRSRVLYIEDNPVNLLIVSEMLRHRPDLCLDTADTGREGVHLARLHRPALVLVDMQLPDIDGMEVLRQLRGNAQTAALRCVALSANAIPEDIRAALDAGFDDYWTKPVDLSAFLGALAAIFGPAPVA